MPSADTAALELLVEEARAYVRYQFRTVQDLEEKGGQLIRFGALIAGLIVAAFSLLVQQEILRVGTVDAVVLALAMGSLLASMTFASLAFRRSDVAVGPRAQRLRDAADLDIARTDVLAELVPAYVHGIQWNNDRIIKGADQKLAVSLLFLLATAALLILEATRLLLVVLHG